MKSCVGCRYADWKRTASGRLHPSGDGTCTFEVAIPKLPVAKRWSTWHTPLVCGGYINRREELHDHCPCYQRPEGGGDGAGPRSTPSSGTPHD